MIVEEQLKKALTKRLANGNFRHLSISQNLIDFTSNDYLGFARSISLNENYIHNNSSQGSTGSRLLTGNSLYAEELETAIAEFHRAETGLLFNCGYMANYGLLSAILKPTYSVIYDLHIHASMQEGIKKSRAKRLPFFHQNMEHLEKQLKKAESPLFVCVEALYSMDGQLAPLNEISQLCEKYGGYLIVDEAHSNGIIGNNGEGLVCKLGLEKQVFARIHTFGKALGAHGAIVLGSTILREYLINFCSPFIYTTSLPISCLMAIKRAYQKLPGAHRERTQLKALQSYLSETIDYPLLLPIETPIIHIPIKEGCIAALTFAQELKYEGLDIRPILSPTVRRGHEGLRVCLHAFNTIEQVILLCDLLKRSRSS